MNFKSLKDYIPYAININTDNIKAQQLPGTAKYLNGLSFFLADEEETKKTVDELFNGVTVNEENGSEETNSVQE